MLWWAQLGLRGLILLASVVLLGLGIGMTMVGAGGMLEQFEPKLNRTAVLLKVSVQQTRGLAFIFQILATAGYATLNVSALAICAASGQRRVHSAAAAVGSGAAGVMYVTVLISMIMPRIKEISKSMNVALERYFKAFRQTGDEKFLSQIHLFLGCCGLENGPVDFETWNRSLPSSCCGLFSGACLRRNSRSKPCRTAVKELSGDDGLFDFGFLAWVLGINSVVLCGLLVMLLFTSGDDSIEQLVLLRQHTEERLGIRWNEIAEGKLAADRSEMQKDQEKPNTPTTPRPVNDGGGFLSSLFDRMPATGRDKELHRALEGAKAPAATDSSGPGNLDRLMIQRLLDKNARGGGIAGILGGQSRDLKEKMDREAEADELRLADRAMLMARAPLEAPGPRLPPNAAAMAQVRRDSKPGNRQLSEKLRREEELEKQRTEAMLKQEKMARGPLEAPGSRLPPDAAAMAQARRDSKPGNRHLAEKLRREEELQKQRREAMLKQEKKLRRQRSKDE